MHFEEHNHCFWRHITVWDTFGPRLEVSRGTGLGAGLAGELGVGLPAEELDHGLPVHGRVQRALQGAPPPFPEAGGGDTYGILWMDAYRMLCVL